MTKKELEERLEIAETNISILLDMINDLYSKIGVSKDPEEARFQYIPFKGSKRVRNATISESIDILHGKIKDTTKAFNMHLLNLHND